MSVLEFAYDCFILFFLSYGLLSDLYYLGKGGKTSEYDQSTLAITAFVTGVFIVWGISILLGVCP